MLGIGEVSRGWFSMSAGMVRGNSESSDGVVSSASQICPKSKRDLVR